MSNPIYQNGTVVGIRNGSEAEYELVREGRGHYPSTYNTADKNPIAGGGRVRSLAYPVSGDNAHYVRFYINLNEESRLIKLNQVGVDSTVDLTKLYADQNRSYRSQTSQDAINTATSIATGVAGAKLGSMAGTGAATYAVKNLFKRKLASGIVGTGTAIGGLLGGAWAGAEMGDVIGELISENLGLTNSLKRLVANITLYTPGNVRANYSINYDMPEDLLTTLAQSDNFEAIKAGLAAVGAPLSGITSDSLDQTVSDTKNAAKTLGRFGRIVATAASPTVSLLSRSAVNAKRDVMFKYVGNRQFVFEYVFAPKSINEAKEVADIIFMFKYFAHPEMLQGYGNFLYLYPAEFDIEYGMNTIEGQKVNPNINKISSCVITDIDVNYAPGGSFQSLEKGEPIITTVSLVFKEIEALHRERIAAGF